MFDQLDSTLQARDHLSASIYDIAACALHEGPGRPVCVHWLADFYQSHGGWGESFSWQDRYLCTYSAAVALLAGGETILAQEALASLETIPALFPDNWTSNFGGLIAALDAYATRRLRLTVIHPVPVQKAIAYDAAKWNTIVKHEQFYNPLTSTVGFFAEWSYVNPAIDVLRIMENFQADNGSISNSPGASAFCLLACEEAGFTDPCIERLQQYVDGINPYQQDVGMLDQAPHFVTAWALINLDPAYRQTLPDLEAISALQEAVNRPGRLVSICDGFTTFPGDMDTTACAIIGLNLTKSERREIFQAFDDMFHEHHYQTFRYERMASVTTNVHVVAAWPDNPRTPLILEWLVQQIEESHGLPTCKWHTSPYYTLGEIGRLFADVDHPVALKLAKQAGATLLNNQNVGGGWGWQEVTGEETSYAILALDRLLQRHLVNRNRAEQALARARQFLRKQPPDYRRLWIGKSLYYVKPLERWLRYLALDTEPVSQLKPLSVLFVDDNPSYRNIFRTIMEYHELESMIMSDAESALSYLGTRTPDVVVMDLVMPGMDGYQACEKIRQMQLGCRIVATTAYYTPGASQRIVSLGFDGYLEKPFNAPAVVPYLQQIVNSTQGIR